MRIPVSLRLSAICLSIAPGRPGLQSRPIPLWPAFGALWLAASVCLVAIAGAEDSDQAARSGGLPADARRMDRWSGPAASIYQADRTVWIIPSDAALQSKRVTVPRGYAPLRSINWKTQPDRQLKFTPEPSRWTFSWKTAPESNSIIEVVFDQKSNIFDRPQAVRATADGSILLHAYQAETHGEKIRFEPQSYKNTVGYWTVPTDYVTWDLVVDQPGTFAVAVLQGCGAGQGGSDARLTVEKNDSVTAKLDFQTIDTGHFQNFRWHHLGSITIPEAGTYRLKIAAERIARAALLDVRAVHLVRQAKRSVRQAKSSD